MKVNSIRPSSDLRNHYNEISKFCHETGDPVYITLNGRGDTTILSIENYSKLMAELELLKMLAESKEEVERGIVAPMEETICKIKESLQLRKNA